MSRRSRYFRSVSVVVAASAAALVFSGTATAEPAPMPVPNPAAELGKAVLGASPLQLQMAAAAQSPQATDAVLRLLGSAGAVPAALELGLSAPQSFMYPAPTLGCGVGSTPATVTLALAQAGPNFPIPPWIERGQMRFQALPGHVDVPKTSDLSVAWFNLATFKGGIVKLDDNIGGIPTLSKTVPTGQGTVLAAMFGGVTYAGGANCFALPTVGSFTA